MQAVWMVVLAGGALLVRVGQALGAMGMARAKNAASAGVRNLADLCVATLCFWALGSAIYSQQHNGVAGIRLDYLVGWAGLSTNWFPMLALVLIATGIVAPANAERSRLGVPLAAGAMLAGIVVPLVAHWVWRGWLNQIGFIDLAGASAIHLTGASCAATCAIFVGAREGKYNRDGSSNMIPGHSVPMMLLAVLLALVGWVPYMLAAAAMSGRGYSADLLAANVFISAAAGGAASLIIGRLRFGKTDVLLACSGVLGGLVAITAAAATAGTPAAFLIGLIAGLLVPWMTVIIDLRWKIDDPSGVIAIHGVGAVWALLAAAIFAPISILDRIRLLGVQVIGTLAVVVIVVVLCSLMLLVIKSITGLRASEADEYDGLDLAEHDINAHPDFQQTTIKSYHLREA